jgi:hypothetical protein
MVKRVKMMMMMTIISFGHKAVDDLSGPNPNPQRRVCAKTRPKKARLAHITRYKVSLLATFGRRCPGYVLKSIREYGESEEIYVFATLVLVDQSGDDICHYSTWHATQALNTRLTNQ